jgi:ribosome-associated protein
MPSPSTRRLVLAAAAAAEDKKAEDLRILELDPVDSGLADYFIICSATSDRQAVAIADEVEYRLKHDFGVYASSVEGRKVGEWILLDYIDFVIHVFVRDKREFYDIERLRKTARNVTPGEIETLLQPAKAPRHASKPAAKKAARKASVPAAKKAAKVSVTAKKAPTKKVIATKAVKPAVKKAVAKTAIKKAVAKKPVLKKTLVPKATAKKAVKKETKPAAKKVVAKKPAVKKTAIKKVAKKTAKRK